MTLGSNKYIPYMKRFFTTLDLCIAMVFATLITREIQACQCHHLLSHISNKECFMKTPIATFEIKKLTPLPMHRIAYVQTTRTSYVEIDPFTMQHTNSSFQSTAIWGSWWKDLRLNITSRVQPCMLGGCPELGHCMITW